MTVRSMGRRGAVAGLCALVAFGAAGCLQDPNASGGAGGNPKEGGVAAGGTADGDGEVQILGAFGGDEATQFTKSMADFEDESGIKIEYVPNQDFDTVVRQRASSGQAPDIALFPQPGGLLDLADQGYVQPIDTYLDFDTIERTLIPGFLEAARLNGRVYGAPMRMAVKSLVWYPKPTYEDAGYPTGARTLQGLTRITDRIKADGTAPWCMGWESDQATGWVGTDWIEEYMLRLWGPDVYDDWWSHNIPFNDKRVVAAFDAFGKLAKTPGNVFGGAKGILNTGFDEAFNPALKPKPDCYLMRQGNFTTGFFPDKVQADLDGNVGIFVFPPDADGFAGQPILGGGDLAALMNGDDEDAIEVMKFLTSDKFGGPWAQAGGWLSPHKTFDASNYPDETSRTMFQIAADADVFRFDASDLMPAQVGSGTFWTGMVEWMSGDKTSQQATTEIENSWPVEEE